MPGGILLSATVVGEREVAGILGAIQDVVADLSPFWRDVVAPAYFADIQDRFALEGQGRTRGGLFARGRQWAPLSPAYRIWKEKHFPGRTILERTGRLKESLDWDGWGPGPDGVFEAHPTFMIAGTSVPYASAHMTGRANMPARPFLSAPVARQFAGLLRTWIVRESKGSRA